MALSLGFHMVVAAVGMAMPIMMLLAEGHWLRTGNPAALPLAKRWAKVTAVLVAMGAISGTALAFELGLLWPRFMAFSGPVIGLAFALEGYAFFIEAIFLGLYLYGWARLNPLAHWLCGWPVALSGAASGILVVSADAWMQSSVGFALGPDGRLTDVDPVAALFNPAWGLMAAHSTLATYQAVGFAAAGVYAWALLRALGRSGCSGVLWVLSGWGEASVSDAGADGRDGGRSWPPSASGSPAAPRRRIGRGSRC